MQRSRLKNIINKSKTLSNKQEVGNPFEQFKKSLPLEIDDNYRLEAAWKAYGSPKDFKSAVWEGLIQPIDENTYKLPSIGYNEETDEYEYLNKGKDNEAVAKDIRVWDNDVIPFVQELKQGGFIRIYNEEKDCWTYSKNKPQEIQTESGEVIDSFQKGGKYSYKESPMQLVELIKNSKANFAKRLLDPNRKVLDLGNGEIGTHKLSYAVNDKGVVVYPEIQEINGELVDLSTDRNAAYESAIQSGDYVIFPSEESAEWFTADNYKHYFPGLEKYAPQSRKFKQEEKSLYKKVKSNKAYYDKDSDTVYYTNDEDLIHEGFHARPDSVLLEQLRPYYENLNDEKIQNFGGNLQFVKRFEGDPGHFYSPEELGARISAAKFRTQGNNYTPEFFKYLRTNENQYGDNMRDLLYMYNDENLSKIFNLGNTQAFKQGGQMNVIPEGALHAHKNNMELAKEGEITHKGIPVVDNDGVQQAEIEREEWTMTKELTEDVEKWYKEYYKEDMPQKDKDELAVKCGKRIVKELLHNTDDRANLIAKMLEEEK